MRYAIKVMFIALDIKCNQKVLIFFLFVHENVQSGYSSEVTYLDISNKYP